MYKIGIVSRHAGLQDELYGVLSGFNRKVIDFVNTFPDGDESLFVVGAPLLTIDLIPNKPLILYPCLHEFLDKDHAGYYKKAFDRGATMVVNHQELGNDFRKVFPDTPTYHIPYAFPFSYSWNGRVEKILILCQKPERLKSYTEKTVEELFEGIPHTHHHTTTVWLDKKEVYKTYEDHRALFYFSNYTYTLVFAEAMTIGIPTITYNEHFAGAYANISVKDDNKIREYAKHLLSDYSVAKKMSERNKQITDSLYNYNEATRMWNKIILDKIHGI